jgi:Kef-type K+ transport system membrane component KefB
MILFAAAAFGVIGSYGKDSLAVPGSSATESSLKAPRAETPAGGEATNAIDKAQPNSGSGAGHAFRSVLVALVAILVAARIFGWLLVRVGQPRVIGEVIAGIVLGPSCLGEVWPEATAFILPPTVAPLLGVLAQMGVILYMFLVGLELNLDSLKSHGRESLLIAHASIAAPFVLGAAFALVLYERFAGPGVPFTTFAMFLGVALSITALPVLARIIADRGLAGTRTGALALGCAAADDATAWCLLAVVVGLVGTQLTAALATWVLAGLFVAAMLLLVRPLMARWLESASGSTPTPTTVALLLVGVLIASLATDIIGIHAIFGAFLLGAVIPHDSKAAHVLGEKLEDVARVLLLPAFFALTGMRTKIGLLDGVDQWVLCGLVVLVATIGKLGGTALAARYCRMDWRTSAELGALMNTRGLVEIIVLDLGLQLGVITAPLFAMMVVMAIATTLMTGPMLSAIARWSGRSKPNTILQTGTTSAAWCRVAGR